jgi:hypothetical protein
MDVLELTVKCVQELHKVFGLSVLFLENSVLGVVGVKVVSVRLLAVHLHDIDDFSNLGHVELLVERVEGGTSLSPVLSLTLGRSRLLGTN